MNTIFILHLISIASFISGAFLFFKNNNTINRIKLFRIQIISLIIWILGPLLLFNHKFEGLNILNILGLSFQVLSLSVFTYLVLKIGKNKFLVAGSNEEPLNFYELGPYKYIRHPFYFSYIANYIGIYLATQSIFYLALILIIFYLYTLMATDEENLFLISRFKNEYAIYKSKTNQIIPFFKSLKQLF